jgi:hypothetical protein
LRKTNNYFVNSAIMPATPTTTIQPNPDIPVGPRKRHPTQRVTENADPLARKRAKRAAIEAIEELVPPRSQPSKSLQDLEAANGSDDDNSVASTTTERIIEVRDGAIDLDKEAQEDEKESDDDDTELGVG